MVVVVPPEDLVVRLVGLVRSRPDIPEGGIMAGVEAVGMADTFMEATITAATITEATADTTTEDMHPKVPYSELFSADSLSEASTALSGGLFMRYQYLRVIMIPTINIPILHLLM